jgi:hypothetical protein
MVDHRGVMTLVFQGCSYREIVAAAGVSHRDVSLVRKVSAEHGMTAASLAGMSDVELGGLFPDGRGRVSDLYEAPDFARVVASMKANRHFEPPQVFCRSVSGHGCWLSEA